jgi:glyoxylase-like metal-dependent hydrolase (beta-lactamase superfamily II)
MVYAVPDCGFARAYVIEEPEGLMVVDVGSIGAAEDVAAWIGSHGGVSPDRVVYIAATHFHVDHIGGMGHLLRRCGEQTKILFHSLVGEYLKGTRKLSPVHDWMAGLLPVALMSGRQVRRWAHLYPESLSGIPLPGLRRIMNLPYREDRIDFLGSGEATAHRIGFGDWEMIETPGHTEDSVSFYSEQSKALLCGDLILNFDKKGCGALNRFCWRREAVEASYGRLCETIRPETLFPGHGEIIHNGPEALLSVRTFR